MIQNVRWRVFRDDRDPAGFGLLGATADRNCEGLTFTRVN